ncbi:MAG: hypothetical protein KatS3mg105_4208 [Gemmatales bacterium]|nr:MAG: hypothetical protein KatS3mg105_4208 [Gemmatales bacterium]
MQKANRLGRTTALFVGVAMFSSLAGLVAVFCLQWLHEGHADADRQTRASEAELPAEKAAANKIGEWPQWRGPKRDGVSPEKILLQWPREGPRVLWKQRTGEGYSSFAISGGKVYTVCQRGSQRNCCMLGCQVGTRGLEVWLPCQLPQRIWLRPTLDANDR